MRTKSLPVVRESVTIPPADTSPEIEEMLASNCPVAVGVSGGKDSDAVALAVEKHLNAVGHTGPRVLIHADLGDIEWAASMDQCQWLAEHLGWELIVVRRAKGGMIDRWEQRWAANVQRYVDLSCVQLILPWSTPDMRFCTSELKTDQICRALSHRFKGQRIVSVTGIRRSESRDRANAPISRVENKLTNKTRGTSGLQWNAIATWSLAQVLEYHQVRGVPLHEAYTKYGASRVSCVACIMSAEKDLVAATKDPRNHGALLRISTLERVSGFGFQGSRWLTAVLLDNGVFKGAAAKTARRSLAYAQEKASIRRQIEAMIPKHMLFEKGWPKAVPTFSEAKLLATVRKEVGRELPVVVKFTSPSAIIGRYEQLMDEKTKKLARSPTEKLKKLA